jgi:hypothetical protein
MSGPVPLTIIYLYADEDAAKTSVNALNELRVPWLEKGDLGKPKIADLSANPGFGLGTADIDRIKVGGAQNVWGVAVRVLSSNAVAVRRAFNPNFIEKVETPDP